MLFSSHKRYSYERNALIEVICQLRFPTILSINTTEPAELQEAIRQEYPQFATRKEQLPPKVVNPGTPQAKMEPQGVINNYTFVSADGFWKVNLTRDFIAISTLRYGGWEDFAHHLDKVLAQFIQIYKPAYFERTGLRYVNAVSRSRLGLSDYLWDDLIAQPYLGILGEADVDETKVTKSAVDTELDLLDGTHMKIHAGPGLVGGAQKDPEPRFVLDGDFSKKSKLAIDQVPATLEALHNHAGGWFNAAITEELREVLGGQPL